MRSGQGPASKGGCKSRFTESQIVAVRLRELEAENARLKKMYSDLTLENAAIKV